MTENLKDLSMEELKERINIMFEGLGFDPEDLHSEIDYFLDELLRATGYAELITHIEDKKKEYKVSFWYS